MMRTRIMDLSRQIQIDDGTGFGRVWDSDCVSFDVTGFPSCVGNVSTHYFGWCIEGTTHSDIRKSVLGTLGPIWLVTAEKPSPECAHLVIESQLNGHCSTAEEAVLRHINSGNCSARVRKAVSTHRYGRGRRYIGGTTIHS